MKSLRTSSIPTRAKTARLFAALVLCVIGALLHREVLTRFGRHNLGVLWLVLEPMLFTLGIAALWYTAKLHTVSAIPVIAFALTGYSAVLVWRNAANRSLNAITVNLGLMYHKNVKVIDILLARAILEIFGGTCSFALLALAFWGFGLCQLPHDMLILLGGWALLCWFGVALSLVVGTLSERSELFERVWHVATYLLFPLSGAVFMVDWLPAAARDAVLWLPMVHGVEMVRHGFFGEAVVTHEDPAFVVVFNLLLTLVGLALAADASRRVQPE